MAEEYRCEICGKGPFKTPQGLAGHKKFSYGEKAPPPLKEEAANLFLAVLYA